MERRCNITYPRPMRSRNIGDEGRANPALLKSYTPMRKSSTVFGKPPGHEPMRKTSVAFNNPPGVLLIKGYAALTRVALVRIISTDGGARATWCGQNQRRRLVKWLHSGLSPSHKHLSPRGATALRDHTQLPQVGGKRSKELHT